MATKRKTKLSEANEMPANGRPTEVKVGYRTIKIKYVRPDFIMDDMTDSYGEFRAREGVIYIQDQLSHKSAAILRGMKFYMRWCIYLVLTKQTVH